MSFPATARKTAWDVLNQVEQRQLWAEDILPRHLDASRLSTADARLCRELVFGTLKGRIFLDYALAPLLASSRPPHARLRNLLRLGAYQLLLLSKIPPHAAVHAVVEIAKTALPHSQVKFVNAVLRELGRRGAPALPAREQDPAGYLAVRHSQPLWLARRWLDRFGEKTAEAMLDAANEAPPLTARVNLLRVSREKVLEELQAAGIAAEPGRAPAALVFPAGLDPARIRGFQQGWWYYQDQASQWVGYIVNPPAGGVCLDLCSAPGGKATHLAELMHDRGRVFAYDPGASKLRRVAQNARRLHLAGVVPIPALPSALQADRVLVDAPCSGLGTLRRHAEIRWRVREEDLGRLARLQAALLDQAAGYVKPGGDLVYATCTTEPEENEQVVSSFLQRHSEFGLHPGPGADGWPERPDWRADGFFATFPGNALRGEDGIFAARLRRQF